MITIYKTGLYDFSDLGLVKPVKFTKKDLKEIASSTVECEITDEHSNNVIGKLNNFVVVDDCLNANKPDNLDIKGKGLSPLFNIGELIDNGDHYILSKPVMSKVGLTDTPRTHILYNSIKSNGDKMEDIQLRNALDDNRKLTEEIGQLKSQIKQLKKDNSEKSDKIKELKSNNNSNDDKLKDYDELKRKANAYDDFVENERQDLIKQIAGDDEKLSEKYSTFSTENLKVVIETQQKNNHKGRGQTPYNSDVDNGNDRIPQPDDEYSWDEFDKDFAATGL